MAFIQDTTAKVKANPLSTLAGGVAGFLIAKRLIKTTNNYYLAGAVIVGALGGAMISASMKTSKSATIKASVTA
jgi:hypothetical protein